jgi:hypothetical protein
MGDRSKTGIYVIKQNSCLGRLEATCAMRVNVAVGPGRSAKTSKKAAPEGAPAKKKWNALI